VVGSGAPIASAPLAKTLIEAIPAIVMGPGAPVVSAPFAAMLIEAIPAIVVAPVVPSIPGRLAAPRLAALRLAALRLAAPLPRFLGGLPTPVLAQFLLCAPLFPLLDGAPPPRRLDVLLVLSEVGTLRECHAAERRRGGEGDEESTPVHFEPPCGLPEDAARASCRL
jgi:hypothetical protein